MDSHFNTLTSELLHQIYGVINMLVNHIYCLPILYTNQFSAQLDDYNSPMNYTNTSFRGRLRITRIFSKFNNHHKTPASLLTTPASLLTTPPSLLIYSQ